MRDLILIAFVFGGLLATLRWPFVGVLLWAWYALASPQQAAYGAAGLSLNMIIAAVTFMSCVLHQEYRKFRLEIVSILLLAFGSWLMLAQAYSLDPTNSAEYHDRFIKILIFTLMVMMTATSRLRFHAILWVFVIVMGFYGFRGGVFTLLTFGQHIYFGLPDNILYDNNHMGIALAASLPMFLYLQGQVANRWVRYGLIILFIFTLIAILGTHSRGALVSLLAFFFIAWLRSNKKLITGIAAVILAIPALMFLPDHWFDRMETISTAQEDASFMGRVDAWVINYKIAEEHPFTGAGLRNPYQDHIARQVEISRTPRAAHSIYFEILGGAGFGGLFFYVMLLGIAWLKAAAAAFKYRYADHDRWRADFGIHAQTSLMVFGLGGASVSLEMWEGYFLLIALISVLGKIMPAKDEYTPAPIINRQREAVA